MNFSEQLNEYISLLGCSAKELAKASSLSTAVISRYRSKDRVPSKNSEQVKKLAEGISNLALNKEISSISKREVISKLNNLLKNETSFSQLGDNFNKIILALNINMAKMARSLNFDASYLSRIRNNQRFPSEPQVFVDTVSNYIVEHFQSKSDKQIVSTLINCKIEDLEDRSTYLNNLVDWFYSEIEESDNYVDSFLQSLNDFNLDEYIKSIHFDELKVPTMPFRLPTTRNYYGIEEMKKGELDFFKSTVLSKSAEPLFMCSDMPMEDMAKDTEFGKKWMFAIAMSLKKGLHLDIIHNLDRPFNEMMIGLESWMPIYMTGQLSPYYLKGVPNNTYCHLNYVSGSVALTGECIKGHHNKGKYYLTNNKEDVSYYKEKASYLLSKAQPLMNIYTADTSNLYSAFIASNSKENGSRRSILSSLPIYTINKQALLKILKRNSVNEEDTNKILNYIAEQKHIIKNILINNSICDEIPEISKEEFEKNPICLSLSGMFYNKKISYTYDEYFEHLKLTKEFANKYKNYTLKINNNNPFKNIQIFILEGKWVMVSKDTHPTIHFVIHHPKLRDAIENFVAPIIE